MKMKKKGRQYTKVYFRAAAMQKILHWYALGLDVDDDNLPAPENIPVEVVPNHTLRSVDPVHTEEG